MNKMNFFRPLVEKAVTEFTVTGFDEFKGLNQALVRVRKSQIAHAYAENEVFWLIASWRAKAVHQHAKVLGLNPIPALLALLYWQQPILIDGVYKNYPADFDSPDVVLDQLREFGVGEHYLGTVNEILSQADCFGCDHSASPHARLFGISLFGTLEPTDDAMALVGYGLEWMVEDEVESELDFAASVLSLLNLLLKIYPAGALDLKTTVIPADTRQAWLQLVSRIYESTAESVLESFYSQRYAMRPVTSITG